MKSIRITFRLQPYQLARGLQTIRQLEPSYKLISLNDIVKTIFHDYLAKMSLNRDHSIAPELIAEITSFLNKSNESKSITLDDLIGIKPKQQLAKISVIDKDNTDLTDKILTEINKLTNPASDFADPNTSDSDISSLTDFSPPKDWIE